MDKFRIDSHKLQFHPRYVSRWLDGKDSWESAKSIYPLYVEVSPMGACNHRCTFCAVDYIGYKTNQLDADMLGERLHEMGKLGVKSVMFAGEGEPLLHKRINDMVLSAKTSGIDVAFTTNGVLLDKLDMLDQCSWVKVSLNAGTKETYARIHQTKEKDWETVWASIHRAANRKGNCTLGVQMVILPENAGETEALQTLCNDAGVDYLVLKPYSQHKFSLTRQYEGWKPVAMPQSSKRLVVREESIATTEIPYDKCQATPYTWAYIMATGDVYSCSAYLLDERFKLGNIASQTFQEIWEGERRKENWAFVRNGLNISECRVNCRMDKVNRYLTELTQPGPHVNFI